MSVSITPSLPTSTDYRDPNDKKVLVTWTNNQKNKSVLQIHTKDPFQMGFTQAMVLAPQIEAVYSNHLNLIAAHKKKSEARQLPKDLVKQTYIPEQYLNELNGILSGLKTYSKANQYEGRNFTIEDLTTIHDTPHLQHLYEQELLSLKHTRKHVASHVNGFSTNIEMETYPGFIGIISATNDNFLSFEITYTNNKFSNTGIPSSLYARQTIERCKAVEEADWDFWGVKTPREKPNSSHTLIASDKTQNCVYEFYGDGNYTTKDTIK